ncbi:MAG TPA: hypothetical protein DCQ06_00520, partial [Myxococcales bacterium]|nr:hypothetical protein [Myxococcales bacterium]
KPVVKFEDIPQQDAARFVHRFAQSYELIVSKPYFKDRLILRTRKQGTADEGPLVTIYASRGEQGARLQQIERTAKQDVRGCGQLLGFPSCCVEAFETNMLAAQGDQDAVNDDAIRALLSQTQDTPGHRLLDPLSDHEMLAFYPCNVRCEAAIEVAKRNLKALKLTAPSAANRAQQLLGRPVLFWRTPFFIVFDPEAIFEPDGRLHYRWARVHVFDDIEVSRLQRLFGAMVLPALGKGDRVDLQAHRIRIWRGAEQIDEIVGHQELAPILARWSA